MKDLCNSLPKVGNGSENRKRGSDDILSYYDKIYATHQLKMRMDKRKEKEGVVIFLVILIRSMQLTS